MLRKCQNFATMSGMIKHNQDGAIDSLFAPLIILVLLLIGAICFGVWAFQGRQVYKNDTDQKIAAAVTVAKQQQTVLDDQQFAQQEKQPLISYYGPEAFGSLTVQYPRTWSGYVDDSDSTTPVNGYFNPGLVPSLNDQNAVYALRVQVLAQTYSSTLSDIQSSEQDGSGFTTTAYSLPKVPKVVGVEITGPVSQIDADNQSSSTDNGIMIVLPLRDQTIEVWTESDQYASDFTNSILPNLSFSP